MFYVLYASSAHVALKAWLWSPGVSHLLKGLMSNLVLSITSCFWMYLCHCASHLNFITTHAVT